MSIASAALLAACGGDDDSAPETPVVTPTVEEPERLSKEEYITQADGICAEVNAALGALTIEATDDSAGQRADLYEGMMENLRDLGTPTDSAGLEDFLSAGDDLVAAERDAEQASADGDDTALAEAESDAAAAGTTFASAAGSYGFEECGQGATTPATTTGAPTATAPVTPAEPVPTAPVEPAPAPTAPSGGAGTDAGGTAGGGTDTGGTSGGSGGVGPG